MKVRFLHASYFVWLVVPLALFAIVRGAGLPHVIWSYEWRGPNGSSGWSQRYYIRCTFIGPHGVFTEYPANGKCAWVRFRRAAGDR